MLIINVWEITFRVDEEMAYTVVATGSKNFLQRVTFKNCFENFADNFNYNQAFENFWLCLVSLCHNKFEKI